MPRVLVTGVSARALAQAAVRAGWTPTVIDAFGDLDCPGTVLPVTPFTPRRALKAAQTCDVDAVAIAAAWEHAPATVERLGAGRRLLASAPEAIRATRDPVRVANALRRAGLPALVTAGAGRTSPPLHAMPTAAAVAVQAWTRLRSPMQAPAATLRLDPWAAITKPLRSGGGHGIERFDAAATMDPRGRYLQEWRDGTAVSLILAADGRDAVPVAVTRQLHGLPWLGCAGHMYAGSIIEAGPQTFSDSGAHDGRLRQQLELLSSVLTRETGIQGLVGVDGIIDAAGDFWLIEINPRWCASFELLDALLSTPLFQIHVEACDGQLPSAWPLQRLPYGIAAKGIVYRHAHALPVAAPRLTLSADALLQLADIPQPDTLLSPGAPVCTLLVRGTHEAHVMQALQEGAALIGAQLESAERATR